MERQLKFSNPAKCRHRKFTGVQWFRRIVSLTHFPHRYSYKGKCRIPRCTNSTTTALRPLAMSSTWISVFICLTILCCMASSLGDNDRSEGQAPHHHSRTRRAASNVMDLPVALDELPNLLPNPSFENPFPAKKDNPWNSGSCKLSWYSQDKQTGNYSMLVSGRQRPLDGPSVVVRGVKPGRGYAVSGYIKLLNDSIALWQEVRIQMQFSFTDSPNKSDYVLVAEADNEVVPPEEATWCARSGEAAKDQAALKPDNSQDIAYDLCYRGFITKVDGWVLLTGDINAPMREFSDNVTLRVNAPDAYIDFLMDDFRLVEVPEHPDWLGQALREGDRNRKTNFTLKFWLPSNVASTDIDLEVALTNHQFAFGAKVEDDCITGGPQTKRYNDFFYSVYNWATVGSYKWRFDKGTRAQPDFSNAIDATTALRRKGIKVRAHCILWDVEENIPDWVVNLSPQETGPAVEEHVIYMINITKGKVEQWDVQNEMLHEKYYENKLKNRTFTMDIFKLVRSLDPNVRLYLNDYQAVTTGAQVQELTKQFLRFREYGAKIDGIGIQGHTKDYVKPDPLMIWMRLNEFGKLDDLDIFVTEFDLGHNDDVIRADWFEDAMRGFFAHPVLKGHIMWGFWNERMRYDNQYLTYGDRFKLSEVATRYACLVKKELTTRLTANLGDYPGSQVTLRGYLGDYVVLVKKKGVVVQREVFKLTASETSFDIFVTVNDTSIAVPMQDDFPSECISHRAQSTVGNVDLISSVAKFVCTTRKESRAAAGEGKVSVTCALDEAMTGCTASVTGNVDAKALLLARLGEIITVEENRSTCTAFIRQGQTSAGLTVTANAVCCKVPSLSCTYRQAGPSLLMENAMAEATCPAGSQLLGCAAYSAKSQLRGVVFRGSNSTSCVTRNGPPLPGSQPDYVSGVMASGVCCTAPGLSCVTVKSEPGRSSVTCPDNSYVMTSCSAQEAFFSADITSSIGRSPVCVIGTAGVGAVATCCACSGLQPSFFDPTPSPTSPAAKPAAVNAFFLLTLLSGVLVFGLLWKINQFTGSIF